jgi:hypothetical protein
LESLKPKPELALSSRAAKTNSWTAVGSPGPVGNKAHSILHDNFMHQHDCDQKHYRLSVSSPIKFLNSHPRNSGEGSEITTHLGSHRRKNMSDLETTAPNKSAISKPIIIISSIVIILIAAISAWFLRTRYVERERVRLAQERIQKFEIYKNSINRILGDFKQLDQNWKDKNAELYGLGQYNDDQVTVGSDGWNTVSGKKENITKEIKAIEAKMKSGAQEGYDLSNNYFNDTNVDPEKKDIAQKKINYFSSVLSKLNGAADGPRTGQAPPTGNVQFDRALSDFPNDQNLRGLIDMWKDSKKVYDNMENDLSNRIKAGQMHPVALQNFISSSEYRANQRGYEKLINERIENLRFNKR